MWSNACQESYPLRVSALNRYNWPTCRTVTTGQHTHYLYTAEQQVGLLTHTDVPCAPFPRQEARLPKPGLRLWFHGGRRQDAAQVSVPDAHKRNTLHSLMRRGPLCCRMGIEGEGRSAKHVSVTGEADVHRASQDLIYCESRKFLVPSSTRDPRATSKPVRRHVRGSFALLKGNEMWREQSNGPR